MENMEEILLEEGLTGDDLQELKSWLFKENIRIMTASAELEEQREKFEQEKDQFKEEMKNLNRKMSAEQSRRKNFWKSGGCMTRTRRRASFSAA